MRLTPRGGADRIEGWETDAAGRRFLKARVRQAPEDGKANAALEALLAAALGVPKSAVAVSRGHTARLKQIEVRGLSEADAMARLSPL